MFWWGEMTITLHDVFCILGIPIEGRACNAPMRYTKLGVAQLLELELQSVSSTMVHYWDAYDKISGWVVDRGAVEAERRSLIASTLLTMLVSGTLFIDKSTNKFRHEVLSMFMDLREAGTFAWGAGVLACLYRGLGEATRVEAKQLDGCALLLQAWVWAYFPQFRTHKDLDRINDPRFAARYLEYKTLPRSTARLISLRRQLDCLTERDVCWMPFGDLDFEHHLRRSRYWGTIRWKNDFEPYMPDRVARQFGRVQGIPNDPIPTDDCNRPASLYQRYRVTFDEVHDQWADADQHLWDIAVIPQATPEVSVMPDYMEWYSQRIHPLIDPTSAPPPPPDA